jgi:hypothetical protein
VAAQFFQKMFLRHIPLPELRRFFATRKCLSTLAWDRLKDNEVDPIFDAWLKLADEDRVHFEHVAREVHDLATPAGIKAIIEEGKFHKLDMAGPLEKIDGLYAKILWTYLEHLQVFKVASFFNHADQLSVRYWRKRKNIPKTAPRVDPAALAELGGELSKYYQNNQGRGHRCIVETYLRTDRYHYFFAYPDDYTATYIGYKQDGEFVRRPQKGAFENVFVYDPEDGTLDLYAPGDKEIKQNLQEIFARVILQVDLGPENPHSHTYDLSKLKSRDFRFRTDPEDGIAEVRVRRLRLVVNSNSKRRIILEANPEAGRNDIFDMIEEYLNKTRLPMSKVSVTMVSFQFRFAPVGDERGKQFSFNVSFPDSCNLKSMPEERRGLGEKYLKEWGIDRA